MSDIDGLLLSHPAGDLLITIIETPAMAISAAAIDCGHHATAGAELISTGALEADGFERVTASRDDEMVTVGWDANCECHSYHSRAAGRRAQSWLNSSGESSRCARSRWLPISMKVCWAAAQRERIRLS